jgi:hypothetical protein
MPENIDPLQFDNVKRAIGLAQDVLRTEVKFTSDYQTFISSTHEEFIRLIVEMMGGKVSYNKSAGEYTCNFL